MRIKLPADVSSAIREVGGLAALLDKNGWKAAAYIAVAKLHPEVFAKKLNAKGWSANVIARHLEGWDRAAGEGLVPPVDELEYGESIDLPTTGWADYYTPPIEGDDRYSRVPDKDAIMAAAQAQGLGGSKAIDIAKNTKSMAAAIQGSPKVREAAAQALIDAGDIHRLSQATAKAAQNRQVERNRERAAAGLPKQRTPQQVKGSGSGTDAIGSVRGLADALRSLVTTFPTEWAGLSDAAKADEDFIDLCEETLDHIQLALANARLIVSGGNVSDDELREFLEAQS